MHCTPERLLFIEELQQQLQLYFICKPKTYVLTSSIKEAVSSTVTVNLDQHNKS